MDSGMQKFCLQWNEFKGIVTSEFYNLREHEDFVDVTLCCEGRQLKAHRLMLSVCSAYFKEVLKGNPCQHPVFFLKDVSYSDLAAVIEFVYTGEVNVTQSNLSSFLKTAEMLQVKGLASDDKDKGHTPSAPRVARPAANHSNFASPSPPRPAPPKRQASAGDAPPSPTVAKRVRADPAGSPRVLPPPSGSAPSPAVSEHSRAGAYPAEWQIPQQVQSTAPPPHQPPPPHPGSSSTAGHDRPERVMVKTESAAHDDGHSMESSSLDADSDYPGMMEFKMTQQTMPPGAEDTLGSQSGAYFSDDASGRGGSGPGAATPGASQSVPVPGYSVSGRPGGAPHNSLACGYCGKIYSHRRTLFQHEKMHQGKTTCTLCGDTLSTVKSLKSHMKSWHPLHDVRGMPQPQGPAC